MEIFCPFLGRENRKRKQTDYGYQKSKNEQKNRKWRKGKRDQESEIMPKEQGLRRMSNWEV